MNKTELLAHLEARLGSRSAAVAALDAVLGEIQGAVASGDRVILTGFGTFEPVTRPARTGRDPRTGAVLEIAASTTPRFRDAKAATSTKSAKPAKSAKSGGSGKKAKKAK